MEELLIPVAGLLLLATPVLAIWAFVRTIGLRHELRAVRGELALMRAHAPVAGVPGASVVAPPPEPAPEPALEPFPEPLPEPVADRGEEADPEPPPLHPIPAVPLPPAPPPLTLEERLTSRWMVWLGAVTLALGGAFLVKYSIDQGLLGPGVRVLLGLALAAVLVALSQWLERRPERRMALGPSVIPEALAAAGCAIAFASLWAAFALYQLVPAVVAFAGMAAVSALAMLLALRHGPFMAILGLLGGFVVPLLVRTGEASAVGLFGYVTVLVAGALGLVRWRPWWWAAWIALAGGMGWCLLWIMAEPVGPVPPLFLLGQFVLFALWGRQSLLWPVVPPELRPRIYEVMRGAVAAVVVVMLAVVQEDGFGLTAVVSFLVLAGGVLALARRDAALDLMPLAPALAGLLLLLAWHLVLPPADPAVIGPHAEYWAGHRTAPAGIARFAGSALALALLFGLGGFAACWGAARPGRWGAYAVAVPVAALAAAYARLHPLGWDLAWTGGALALAALFLVAAMATARHRYHGMEAALAAFAVGVAASTALAAVMALEQAWLTVALAAHLPALAWVAQRVHVPVLRRVAEAVALAVLVRLVLNPQLLDYPLEATPVANWLIYGYGLPAVSFWLAARWFRRQADDRLVMLLEGGAVAFATLLLNLEIRHLLTGSLQETRDGLLEPALQVTAWLAVAAALYLGGRRAVPLWAGRLLLGLAALVALLALGVDNPWASGWPVGETRIFNDLLLLYGAPAALAGLVALAAWRRGLSLDARLAGVLCLIEVFLLVTLEVRQAFHGSDLLIGAVSEAEGYAYSAAWLVLAGLVLGLGLWQRSGSLRHAGLGLILLTVAKVFLIDMSELEGIWRAASFLGLGASLVALGWVYRRFAPAPGG